MSDAWAQVFNLQRVFTKEWKPRPNLRIRAIAHERSVELALGKWTENKWGSGSEARAMDFLCCSTQRNVCTMREVAQALNEACDFVEQSNPRWANLTDTTSLRDRLEEALAEAIEIAKSKREVFTQSSGALPARANYHEALGYQRGLAKAITLLNAQEKAEQKHLYDMGVTNPQGPQLGDEPTQGDAAATTQPIQPEFCSSCGSRTAWWGHDDNCPAK